MQCEYIHLFTDGACRGNQNDNNIGAWGAYMKYKQFEHSVKGGTRNTTNNIMELTGCIEGLKSITNKEIPVIVYLDSAYVLNGITSWISKWKINGWRTSNKKAVENKELWIRLDNLVSEFKNIKFEKVKGHSDNEGNIKADLLCNKYMDEMERI